MEVKTIKLTNGEEFIAEVLEGDREGYISVKHPVVLIQTPSGEYDFSPWITTSHATDYAVLMSDIRFMVDPQDVLIEAFIRNFKQSSIVTPSSNIILG